MGESTSEQELRAWASQHLDVEIGIALAGACWAGALFWEANEEEGLTLEELLLRAPRRIVAPFIGQPGRMRPLPFPQLAVKDRPLLAVGCRDQPQAAVRSRLDAAVGEAEDMEEEDIGGKNTVTVNAGDVLTIRTPGGGGYGEKTTRARETR